MKQTVTLGAHLLPPTVVPPIALVERWEKRLGEMVAAGESLVTLRSGEEMVSVPSPVYGILAKRMVLPGEAVEAGEPVAVLSGVPLSAAETAPPAHDPFAAPVYVPGGPEEVVALSPFDTALAAEQARSLRDAPHVYTVAIADISEVLRITAKAARGETVSGAAETLTLLPFVLSAVAASLRVFPALNSQWIDTREIRRKRYIHLGVERTDSEGRLIVPVVRDAERKSVLALAREIAERATLAQAGGLTPADVSGATFTVSEAANVLYRTPILHTPLGGHLCFGKPTPQAHLYLCLAHDARVVDSATASAFLADVVQGLETARFLFA